MKRFTLVLGVFVIVLSALMLYALSRTEQSPVDLKMGQRSQSVSGVRENPEEDLSTYTTSTSVFASSTLGIQLSVPGGGYALWKTLDQGTGSSQVYARVKILRLNTREGEIGCAVSLAVVPGSITALISDAFPGTPVQQIAGNEYVHVAATQKDLCGATLTFDIGPKIQATYLTRGIDLGQIPKNDYETCTDYRLAAPQEGLDGRTEVMTFSDRTIGLPLIGERVFRGQDGGCVPFSLRMRPVPGSDQYVLYVRSIAERGLYDRAMGMMSIDGSDKWTIFSEPAMIEDEVSPDQRFIVKAYETLVEGQTRHQLVVQDLRTGTYPLPKPVLIASGRMVGLLPDTYDLMQRPFEWLGPRSVRVTTIERELPITAKTFILTF